jgi:hypothetical protein
MPDDCTFASTCDAQTLSNPVLDVAGAAASGGEMFLAVQMTNQLPNNADQSTGAVNTHDAHFESYSVDYQGSGGLLPPSTGGIPAAAGPAQQNIPAEGTSVIGFNPFPFTLVEDLAASTAIPDWTTTNLGEYVQVVAKVHLKGRLDDASKWETELAIPIRLCKNCVFAGCDDPTKTPVAACPSLFQEPHGKATCQ